MRKKPFSGTSVHSQLLLAFLLVGLLPALILSAASAWSSYDVGRRRTLDQLFSIAEIKASEIDMWTDELKLGLDMTLNDHDLGETILPLLQDKFSVAEARKVKADLKRNIESAAAKGQLFSHVCLTDTKGLVILSTNPEHESKEMSDRDYYQQGLQKNYVSPPYHESEQNRRLVVSVSHPIIAPGRGAVGVLVGHSDISVLDRIMEEPMGLGQSGESYLVGSNYVPLTRLRFGIERAETQMKSEGIRRAVENKIRGYGTYLDYRGTPTLGVYTWLPELQVVLVVEQDEDEVNDSFTTTVAINLSVALAAVAFILIVASLVTRSIAKPLLALSTAAAQIASGDLNRTAELDREDEIGKLAAAFNLMTGRLRGLIERLQTELVERKKAEEQVKKTLSEKEALLRELHHRTKNNMGVIIALLDLQAEDLGDKRIKEAFTDTQNRIRSMALVHQKLYEAGDLSRINLKDYITDLANILVKSYRVAPGGISVVREMEDVQVLIDTAIPCGLILNELISNALKFAFIGRKEGVLRIGLRRLEDGEIALSVSDDGRGPPPGFDFRRDGHMGLQTVFALGENQLNGKVDFESNGGVACRIKFRDNLYKARV